MNKYVHMYVHVWCAHLSMPQEVYICMYVYAICLYVYT